MLIGQEITILGAGVAGLTLARALALRGAKVTLYEQAEAIREVGAGLQISPNGAVVLEALGLGSAMRKAGMVSEAVELRDGLDDGLVARMEMARLRPRHLWRLVHRADLISLLHEGALEAGVELRLLQRIERVDLLPDGAVLTTAQGAEIRPSVVIGADGLHSVVRRALEGESQPFFTGQVAWRAMIPCEAGAPPIPEIHMGAGRHLVSYPLRGGTLRNIVAVEERRTWAAEGWSIPDDPQELRMAFESFSPRVRAWLDQVEECYLWGLFRHNVAREWSWTAPDAPSKGVAILGDAVHPTLPFMAQGANMALEDAWTLAEAIATHDGLGAGLAHWQQSRHRRVSEIVAAANSNARNYHLRTPMREIAHLGLRTISRIAPSRLVGRFDWLQTFDVTKGASGH